jgi:alanyl-tRNA synthetase
VTGEEIRSRFLRHFQERDHRVLESAPLVPADDPTTLFISAGMQPLQPYYQGLRPPPHPRLASCQKCLRTDDLAEVGDDRHETFFEMLGNFAPTGDYFKERAIPWAWELVTDPERGLGLPPERLRVTTHPSDEEARRIWRTETGVRPEWVYERADNWWGLDVGPCGPDSELWWDRGLEYGCGRPDCSPDHDPGCQRFLEFWNLVFPQYDRQPDGSLPPLAAPAIDTGMGLERMASIVQGVPTIFDTDLFAPVIGFVAEHARQRLQRPERIIADHLRAATFLCADGVVPATEGRGYVLRRIVRRAVLHARRMGLRRPLAEGIRVVVAVMRDRYPYLLERAEDVRQAVAAEEQAFGRTLERGLELFEELAARHPEGIPGAEAFRLHDTFGFPLELTLELAAERGLAVDQAGFQAAMAEQRERSRRAHRVHWLEARGLPTSTFTGYEELENGAVVLSLRREGAEVEELVEGEEGEVYLDRTPFYAESGGQIGDTGRIVGERGEFRVDDTQRPREGVVAHLGGVTLGRVGRGDRVRAVVDERRRRQIMRHHTATHLLNRALEELLGRRNLQRGSWVGPDHTTFDFPLDRPLSAEELERLQTRIREQVRAALPLTARILPYPEAVATGATHLFDERYGDLVRVVCFGDWSCEFCGGTHAPTTADVGTVLITSESSVGHGLRRIDMTVGEAAEALLARRLRALEEAARAMGVAAEQVPERLAELRRELKEQGREIERLRDQVRQAALRGGGLRRRPARVPLVAEEVPAQDLVDLRGWADRYLEALGGSGVVAVAGDSNFVIKVSRDLAEEYAADRLAGLFGSGGGQPGLAQGRLRRPAAEAFEALEAALR